MRTYEELEKVYQELKIKHGGQIRRSTIVSSVGPTFLKTEIKIIHKKMQHLKKSENVARTYLLRKRRKSLVRNATNSELILKRFLEENKINFVFQHGCKLKKGTCFFIIDFFFPKSKIGIELDGSSHIGKEESDRKRTWWLKENGFVSKILRYKNEDMENIQKLLEIKELLVCDKPVENKIKLRKEIQCPTCLCYFQHET